MRKREKVKMSLRKENSQPNSHQDFAEETNAVDLNFSDVFSAIEIPAGQKNDKSLDMASASATASDQKANTPVSTILNDFDCTSAGVGNPRLQSHMRLFEPPVVALFGGKQRPFFRNHFRNN